MSFVEDLVKKEIINGPKPAGAKRHGRGIAQRFMPRDYRDLFEVIVLKLSGIKHRDAWVFQLWLRGREFPTKEVRRAIIAELHPIVEKAKKDIAPTLRWTEPFGKKYDRRVRANASADDLVDLLEVVAALMIRPEAVTEVTPDANKISATLASAANVPLQQVKGFVEELVAATKEGRSVDPSAADAFHEVMQRSRLGSVYSTIMPALKAQSDEIVKSLTGAFDDGAGRSGLVDAVRGSSDDQLLRTREIYRMTRSRHLEPCLQQNKEACPQAILPLFEVVSAMTAAQRSLIRFNPKLSAQVFATYLRDLVVSESGAH